MVLNDEMLAEVAIVQNEHLDIHSSWIDSCRDPRTTVDTVHPGRVTVGKPIDREALQMADTLSAAAAQFNQSIEHQRIIDVGSLPVQPLGEFLQFYQSINS